MASNQGEGWAFTNPRVMEEAAAWRVGREVSAPPIPTAAAQVAHPARKPRRLGRLLAQVLGGIRSLMQPPIPGWIIADR